jgi:molecular chaperone HtpG
MKTGKISVHTENIFPIIKKFLYTDQEIFIRELVSNAVDATQKIKALASIGDYKGEVGDVKIQVKVDEDTKTITISDMGIGLTQDEIEKYINQIAFSGAEEFVNKFKEKTDTSIIGHFGMGFYSAFMVANKVEIQSLSYKDGEKASFWSCDGTTDFNLGEGEKQERGTDIILHVDEESLEFCNKFKIKSILTKYCKYLPIPIEFDGSIINPTKPLWTEKPTELKEDDYQKFYTELYPFAQNSLFHIHLNVDYPFNLTGILYFPKLTDKFEPEKHKVQLYSNQVFVTEDVKDILPEYLVLLQGVIDSPDIPLNVSRSALQSDTNVKKITTHISKKVADKLAELFKNDRKDFENKWEYTELFVKYGMVSDEKFYDKAVDFALLKDIDSNFYTIKELEDKIKTHQVNKDKKTVMLYSNNIEQQAIYVNQAKSAGYTVINLSGYADQYFINKIEEKFENIVCRRVDSDLLDNLIDSGIENTSLRSSEEETQITEIFNKIKEEGFEFEIAKLNSTDSPLLITESEFDRRFKEMSQTQAMFASIPMNASYKVKINVNHPLMEKLLTSDIEKQEVLSQHLLDLAMLGKNLLKGEKLAAFLNRSIHILN